MCNAHPGHYYASLRPMNSQSVALLQVSVSFDLKIKLKVMLDCQIWEDKML